MTQFIIDCDECKGRGTVETFALPSAVASNMPMGSLTEATASFERAFVKCAGCDGVGNRPATEPIPVVREGITVGTVPPSFNPDNIKSTSYVYRPRSGDFRRAGNCWQASPALGDGDLEAVAGFRWKR